MRPGEVSLSISALIMILLAFCMLILLQISTHQRVLGVHKVLPITVTWRVPHHSSIFWIKGICSYLVILSGMQHSLQPLEHHLLCCRFITKNWATSMGISQTSSSLPSTIEDSLQILLTDAKSLPSILYDACLQRIQPYFSLSYLTPRTSASCMKSDSILNPEIWVATTLLSLGTVAETIHLLNTWVM